MSRRIGQSRSMWEVPKLKEEITGRTESVAQGGVGRKGSTFNACHAKHC
jgi:hypothetical protein